MEEVLQVFSVIKKDDKNEQIDEMVVVGLRGSLTKMNEIVCIRGSGIHNSS